MGAKKSGFWKTEWFLGLMATVVVLAASGGTTIQRMERAAYDWGVQLTSRVPSDKIAVIAIDKASIDNIGRWPWSRDVMARMVEQLASADAKVVASTIFFSEPQRDAGLDYIDRLVESCGLSAKAEEGEVIASTCGSAVPLLLEAESKLNTDRRLAQAFQQSKTAITPMLFRLGDPLGQPDKPLPDYVQRNALKAVGTESGILVPAAEVDALPIPELGRAARSIGHLNVTYDVDGAVRAEPLAVGYFNEAYPSLALAVALRALNLEPADVKVRIGESVRLGKLKIGTDAQTRMLTFYYQEQDGKPPFPVDSFFDVASGKVPLEKYRNKVVLIGPTVAGVGSTFVTPVSPEMPSVLMEAHAVSSVLSGHFFVAPTWGLAVEGLAFMLVAAYLMLAMPRLKAGAAALATLVLLVLFAAGHFLLMTTQLIWLQFVAPSVLLVLGHVLITTRRFLLTERGKEVSEQDSAESNRMLGLAFQGQGQLDMAFDKFRKCPVDASLMEALYSLALDFERKRQFSKAEAVLRYMADFDASFRDIASRQARLKQMAETVILGGNKGTNASLMVDGGTVEKPMLGRYQIERELGKGAMGVVYQGRDPKINRVVAIKTLALSQEFEEDELVEVKERFFREAETAGRLNHPNIVTIFDAGEEHDLAYIAMELLKGRDLVPNTRAEALLPLPQVVSIVARVADALNYAHQNNVVHRDVKPANIMYEVESDGVKVTDFGIARITDSSRTKTGMVLGTPSYMSPEQLSGMRIDGRSDLFSLGVALYQLSCGKLPFEGDSMAQLMFRIANQPHPDIRVVRPDIPENLVQVIDRALAKDLAQRYQTGAEMAIELRACLAQLGGSAPVTSASVDFSL